MRDVPSVQRTLSQEQLHAYADASGDHNPIHVDPEFAAGTPFGGTIAHGMLVLSLIGEMMHAAFGADWVTSGGLKVRFKAPARPGDVVRAIAEAARDDGDGHLVYAVQCTNRAGDVLIEGRATVEAAG
jgi:3-hydroxybutyryl-CoA dehydratase